MKGITQLFLIATTIIYSIGAQGGAQALVSIKSKNTEKQFLELKSKGYSVEQHGRDQLHIAVEDSELFLNENNISSDQVIEILKNQPLKKSNTDQVSEYFNPEQSLEKLTELENKFPQYAKVFDLNTWLGIPETAEGKHLYALQISENPAILEDEIKILMIGQHHAREIMTHHAVLDAAEDFLYKIATDSSGKDFIKKGAIWFVPIVNPDGLNHVFDKSAMWRKNRSYNSNGARGVDLNRNYGFKWGACGNHSASESSIVYKGPAAQSEPEVQIMDSLNNKLRAQFLISYHSSGNEVLYPYLCGNMVEKEVYNSLRDRLAQHLNFGKRTATSSGEDFEHHYGRYGSLSFLLEIGRSFQPSFETYKTTVWPTVQKVLPFLIQETKQSFMELKVTDSSGAAMVGASVKVDGFSFEEGETRTTDSFGTIRWRLPEGTYNVKLKKDALSWSGQVAVESGKPALTVKMKN